MFDRMGAGEGGAVRTEKEGPASGENRGLSCRLRILGYFGLDSPKRGSGLVGNNLMSVHRAVGGVKKSRVERLKENVEPLSA